MTAIRLTIVITALVGGASPVSARDMAATIDALIAAYPDALAGRTGDDLLWRDGTRMPIGDGTPEKPFELRLRNASIADQFSVLYPKGAMTTPPSVNSDPGRFRNTAFFQKMYGNCKTGDVSKKLVSIVWLPKSWGKVVQVTKVNGVAEKLKLISAEIDELAPAIKSAAFPIAGVLSCRPVADTGVMSMHGYAAAIDLNVQLSDYWLWSGKGQQPIKYRNRMPQQIVDIFERHGFIWGGKWYHYDTMHFEYRPELLANP